MELILNNSDFLLGIYSGLTVAVLLYIIGRIIKYLKRNIKNWRVYNVLKKTQVLYVYGNLEEAKEQIVEDMKRSEVMYVFSSIEPSLSKITDPMYELLKQKSGDIKLLLLDPASADAAKRGRELKLASFSPETIKASSDPLLNLEKVNSNIKIALHHEFLRNKFYIFDDAMYLGFRLKDKMSDQSQIWRISRESLTYKAFLLQFNDIWEKCDKPIEKEQEADKSI